MSAKSNYLEAKILDHVLRNTSFSQPSALVLALFVTGGASDAAVEAVGDQKVAHRVQGDAA